MEKRNFQNLLLKRKWEDRRKRYCQYPIAEQKITQNRLNIHLSKDTIRSWNWTYYLLVAEQGQIKTYLKNLKRLLITDSSDLFALFFQ